jgi:hypothetical protein
MHFLAYLLIGLISGASALILLTVLGAAAVGLSSRSLAEGVHAVPSRLFSAAPFALIPAVIGMLIAIFMEAGIYRRFWFVAEGLLCGIAAAMMAVIAVLARSDAQINDIVDLILLNPDLFKDFPELRIIKFVGPIVFAMGVCIGLIIPAAYRRYRQELVAKDVRAMQSMKLVSAR